MNRSYLRNVMIVDKNQTLKNRGYFHKWGISKHISYDEITKKKVALSVTKAIVELEDGEIIELYPTEIRFI